MLLHEKADLYPDGPRAEESEWPDDIHTMADPAREKLIEAVAESDDALIEEYLEQGTLPSNGLVVYMIRAATLYDRPHSGRPSLWTEETRALLVVLLSYNPRQLGYFAANGTVPLLQDQRQRCLGLSVADDTIRREWRRQNYV